MSPSPIHGENLVGEGEGCLVAVIVDAPLLTQKHKSLYAVLGFWVQFNSKGEYPLVSVDLGHH